MAVHREALLKELECRLKDPSDNPGIQKHIFHCVESGSLTLQDIQDWLLSTDSPLGYCFALKPSTIKRLRVPLGQYHCLMQGMVPCDPKGNIQPYSLFLALREDVTNPVYLARLKDAFGISDVDNYKNLSRCGFLAFRIKMN